MNATRLLICCIITGLFLVSCKEKKKVSLSGEEEVVIADFIDFFPSLETPYRLADTTLLKKDNDSLSIGIKVLKQFVPDSVVNKLFGKNANPKIYPIGKVEGAEQYIFIKTVAGTTRNAFIIAFDKKNNFLSALPFLKNDNLRTTEQHSVLDEKMTIFKNIVRKNADGTSSDGKDVYAYNSSSKEFMLILTDALDIKEKELINPIDTLSVKQKYTADYGSGKSNLISFRDGRSKDKLSFFIHVEKNNGDCTGELKGEARMKNATTAEYRQPGDPCSLEFKFTATTVTIKEIEGCGARRGLRCSFDGVYPRKKATKKS